MLTTLDLGWVEGVGGGGGLSSRVKRLSLIRSKTQSGFLGGYFCVGLVLCYF